MNEVQHWKSLKNKISLIYITEMSNRIKYNRLFKIFAKIHLPKLLKCHKKWWYLLDTQMDIENKKESPLEGYDYCKHVINSPRIEISIGR